MQLRALLIIAVTVVAACTSDPAPPPAVLPSDAMFLEPGVTTCLATQPNDEGNEFPCCQVLILYASGEISKLSGFEGFSGSYELDGNVARGTLRGEAFAFDLTTDIATGASLIAGIWIPDTENVTALACEPP